MTSNKDVPHVLIVGGGLAGTAVVLRLLKDGVQPLRVTIVESREVVGPGVAYSTPHAEHLVNGLAQMFSLYEDDPGHFSRWLQTRSLAGGWQPEPGISFDNSIPPRKVYGEYVQSTLADALAAAGGRVLFRHHRGRVVDVTPQPDGYGVRLDDGQTLAADRVVLATGVFARPAHRQPFRVDPAVLQSRRYVANLWDVSAWEGVDQDQTVAFLGAGLSALDGLISAEKAGFKGRYVAMSRRGLPVHARRNVTPWPDFLVYDAERPALRSVLRQIQRQRRLIAAQGEDWQRIVPAIRQHVPALWQAASPAERARFLHRLRAYWEVALHRSAADALSWQARVEGQQRYRHEAGAVQDIALQTDGRLAITYRPRHGHETRTLVVDRLVNCLGFEHDWTKIDDPLIANLLRRGLVLPDGLGFGIQARRTDGTVLNQAGQPQPGLHAVGHPLRGLFWESNAIPEQVPQAGLVARAIVQAQAPAAEAVEVAA